MTNPLRFFHPVLLSNQLRRKPVKIQLAGSDYALFRDKTGQAHGLSDRCSHRFAPLSGGWVRPDGRLACPYHGWHFGGDGCGQSPTVQTQTCSIPSLAVVEKNDLIWIAAPGTSPETIPDPELPGFKFVSSFCTIFEAPLHVALDNFNEDEHTPFIHHRLGWTEQQAPLVEFECTNHPDHCEVHYRAPQRTNLFWILRGDTFFNSWKVYFDPPRIHYHLYWMNPSRTKRRWLELFVMIYFVPITETTTSVNSSLFIKLDRRIDWTRPLAGRVASWMVSNEVKDDARFIPTIAKTPFEMRGMRLGKFDKPLVHSHKLLQQIYWGTESSSMESNSG